MQASRYAPAVWARHQRRHLLSENPQLRRPPLEPWRPARVPKLHDEAYLDRFIDGALSILERTGVRVLSDRAIETFREHGAAFEAEHRVVRLPASLVRGALAGAPRSFILGSRDGSCAIDLASGNTYMAADGCGTEVIDGGRASAVASRDERTRARTSSRKAGVLTSILEQSGNRRRPMCGLPSLCGKVGLTGEGEVPMKFAASSSLVIGGLMLAQWTFFIAAGQVSELETEPIPDRLPPGRRGGDCIRPDRRGRISLLRGGRSAIALGLVANGMLVYTVIVSPGYFAQKGQWPLVGMFAIVLAFAIVSIVNLAKAARDR